MSATNPLFDRKVLKVGEAELRMSPLSGRDDYLVEMGFPLDSWRVYTSKWADPMRAAIEAAKEALDALERNCSNTERGGEDEEKKP